MKKIALLLIGTLLALWVQAQQSVVPQAFKYQAVARDTKGDPMANQPIDIRISVQDAGMLGTLFYIEDHSLTTSPAGVFDLSIGKGQPLSGTFSNVPWQSGSLQLRVELSMDNGTTWTLMGISPLHSVPYALFAGSAAKTGDVSYIVNSAGNTRVDTESPFATEKVLVTLSGTPAAIFIPATNYNRLELLGSHHNTVIGENAMPANSGIQNTVFGWNAMNNTQDGSNNTAIGSQAMLLNANGSDNTAVGINALVLGMSGDRNVAIGANALYNNSASNNIAIGKDAMYFNKNAGENVAIGTGVMNDLTLGHGNVAVGHLAMDYATKGSYNTAIGYAAYCNSSSNDSLVNATALGAQALANASNSVRIGNFAVTSIGGHANWTNTSDARVKYDVQENVPGLDLVLNLRPVTYRLDRQGIARLSGMESAAVEVPDPARYTGFVAQEVEAAAKGLGYSFSAVDKPQNDTGLYGLRYAEFTVPLVKAVQELHAEMQALKAENALLKERLDKLEAALAK